MPRRQCQQRPALKPVKRQPFTRPVKKQRTLRTRQHPERPEPRWGIFCLTSGRNCWAEENSTWKTTADRLLGGGEFHLEDCRGQVVILNLWATTCAPCIEELPYYEELKESQPEVEILAIHHRVGAKKAEDFLADKGWDHLDFALDSKEKELYALLEASDALPQTIVLNKEGKVIYNAQSPLTLEQLKALVEQGQV